MSPDSEDTALEEALRADLPSPDTSARLRKRLLASGLAVGNGMAVTTAAAAGGSPGVVAALVSKGLALSWGVKLGALAVVAIPTVGLIVESRSEPALAPPPMAAAQHRTPEREPERLQSPPALALPSEEAAASDGATTPPEPRKAPPEPVAAVSPRAPSQLEFAPPTTQGDLKAASTLAEETRLLDSAFAEIAAGRDARAAELVAEHERRFPAGLLQKERQRAKARLSEMSRGD